jgi:glycoside/pentoside/hexuronide:cation symporter, GPH family
MKSGTERLSVIEKLGYSVGDLAANLVFQTLMTFLAYYYTDVYMLSPAMASTIMFIGGIFGAFFNVIMGVIADRTNTRWGKFRPWILWTAIPFGAAAMLAFTIPDFGATGKMVYALTTYLFLMMMYSMNNLPYSALSGVLTGNMADRNSLSAYRFIAVLIAQFVVQVLLLPLVLVLGGGDSAEGFKTTMTIFSVVGSILLLVTFFTTKERVVAKVEQASSIGQDLKDLVKNKPWVIMLVLTISLFVTLALKGGSYIYYFKNYVDEAHLLVFLEKFQFNDFMHAVDNTFLNLGLEETEWKKELRTTAFSLFNALGIIFSMFGIFCSKSLADRFGKRDVFMFGLSLATIFIFSFYFFTPNTVGLIFLAQILQGFFYGITIPLLWAMIADVADYSEWKNNRRATAIIFSAMIFGLKAGLTIGQALIPTILSWFTYDSLLGVQNDLALTGIKLTVSVFSAIPFAVGVLLLFKYEINKSMELKLEKELELRRKEQIL